MGLLLHKKKNSLGALLLVLLAAALLLWFLNALSGLSAGEDAEGRSRLEDALRRSAAACYAAEGMYPPDLAYLQQHYGLQIDEERYQVFYEVFADNLMPDITVIENREAPL